RPRADARRGARLRRRLRGGGRPALRRRRADAPVGRLRLFLRLHRPLRLGPRRRRAGRARDLPPPRRAVPRVTGWADEGVIYHLPAPGAAGPPPRNDGAPPAEPRLDKLRPWIDHAARLGATTVLVGPVFESGSHGYDTIDLFRVDRRLGTDDT